MKNKYSLSIGIPTYEAGESLVYTLKSLYGQTGFKFVEKIYLVVDGNKIDRKILRKIKNRKLNIYYAKERNGQSARINDIFKKANSDYLLLTNDDVIMAKNCLKNIYQAINKTDSGLLACNVLPISPRTTLQKIFNAGYEINQKITLSWDNGINYLSCNGRGIILNKALFKKIIIPEKLWNNDAFIFIYSRLNRFNFSFLKNVKVWYQLPTNITEYTKQSKKFEYSYLENKKYFKTDIKIFYKKPFFKSIFSFIKALINNPVYTVAYLPVFIHSQFSLSGRESMFNKSYWETDKSTKLNLGI